MRVKDLYLAKGSELSQSNFREMAVAPALLTKVLLIGAGTGAG